MHKKKDYLFFDFFNYIRPDFFLLYAPLTRGIFWNDFPIDAEVSFPTPSFNHPHSTRLYKAYKLWQNGVLPLDKITCASKQLIPPNLIDNYLFISYEFGIKQALLILIRRMLSLKNPFKNIVAFLYAIKNSTRQKLNVQPEKELKTFDKIQEQDVSVIINTRNRHDSLDKLLHQLENQTMIPLEILVIDQSEQTIQPAYANTVTIKQIPCTEIGFVTGRNLGISEAKGSLLIFVDDDCEILPDFIEQHVSFFKNEFMVSTGPVIEQLNGTLSNHRQNKERIAWHLPGGNFMISKEMINRIGVFNPEYNKVPYEDLEYYLRLLKADTLVTCNFRAPIYHKKLPYGGSRNSLFALKYLREIITLTKRKVLKLYIDLLPHSTILMVVNNRFLNTLFSLFRKIYYPACFIETILTILVWPYVYIFCRIALEKNNSK